MIALNRLAPGAAQLSSLALAAASAAIWAVGVTVLQPLSENIDPGLMVEDHRYWTRELRFGALMALVLVLIVLARGGRRATGAVLAGGCAWLAADVVLDRMDHVSGTAQLAIGAAAVALLCGAAASATPVCGAAASAARAEPRPDALLTVATIAAVGSGLATLTDSPTGTEPELRAGSAVVGSLLALVAVLAAAQAAGPVSRSRARTVIPAGVLAAAVPLLLRYASPRVSGGVFLAVFAFTVLLVVIVVALARPQPRSQWRCPAAAVIATGALTVMFPPLMIFSALLQTGEPFTALAGNPPVDEAEVDALVVLLAVPIGLVLGSVLRGFTR
ncbi:hypothetical protein AB0F81_13780 [Actinoplanes sp. NPDC024001]|uniref:hypothetical protein n=1 Tax=Actinoplanes sp. NPDC024001 TaxID=3154598 RepID=UPI0033C3BCBF